MIFKNKDCIELGIDCMGGDNAPHSIIKGACLSSKELKKTVFFHFFGDEERIQEIIEKEKIYSKYKIHHCTTVISSDAKPSSILRGMNREYKDSSMTRAIRANKEGIVDAVISAGNTGAMMVLGRFILGVLNGVDRPAIVSRVPNELGKSFAMLDLGANIGCTTDDLLQFSLMGAAFAKAAQINENQDKPRLALLNIGEEEIKGNDAIKGAYKVLKNSAHQNNFFEFLGYCEPNNVFSGVFDVIVCDGFAGNVALKTAEGTGIMIKKFLNQVFKKSWITKLGYFLVSRSLKKTMKLIDPRNHNGGMFVGLNGILAKAHGGSDEKAFHNAVIFTYKLVENKINEKIIKEIEENDLILNENFD